MTLGHLDFDLAGERQSLGGQFDQHDSLGRQALAASGEAQAFGRGRLDADSVQRKLQQVCEAFAHGLAMRLHLGLFADQSDVHIDDAPAARRHALSRVNQEAVRRGALPLRIAGREMVADVAVGDRAKNGVGQGVQARIGVRMADQGLVVRNLDPAQPDRRTGAPAMDIEALSDANDSAGSGERLGGAVPTKQLWQIVGLPGGAVWIELDIRAERHLEPQPLG